MCHGPNEDTAWQCRGCGYEFGQSIEKLRELLHDQLRSARIVFWVLLVLDLAVLGGCVVGAYYGILVRPSLAFFFVIAWTVRAHHKLSVTRHSLALIDKQQAALPKATLRSG